MNLLPIIHLQWVLSFWIILIICAQRGMIITPRMLSWYLSSWHLWMEPARWATWLFLDSPISLIFLILLYEGQDVLTRKSSWHHPIDMNDIIFFITICLLCLISLRLRPSVLLWVKRQGDMLEVIYNCLQVAFQSNIILISYPLRTKQKTHPWIELKILWKDVWSRLLPP